MVHLDLHQLITHLLHHLLTLLREVPQIIAPLHQAVLRDLLHLARDLDAEQEVKQDALQDVTQDASQDVTQGS